MRDLTFGQYYPTDSFVHRMDARVKILLNVLFMVGVFFVQSYVVFGAMALLLALSIACSKVPFKSIIRSIKGILVLLIFTAAINLFVSTEGTLWVDWWIITIYSGGVISATQLMLRLAFLMMGSSILTLTTTPVDLTHAIESLFRPVRKILPVHEFALIMSLTLSFIPSLVSETDRIIRAQKARGANFDTGGLIARAKAFVPILIPLLVSSFRRAEELAFAMNSRCYEGSTNRTKMRILSTSWRDYVASAIYVLFFAGVFVLFGMAETWSKILPWLYI